MTLEHWFPIIEKNDYTQVVKTGTPPPIEVCHDHYLKICDEIMEKHGVSSEYKEYLRALRQANILAARFLKSIDPKHNGERPGDGFMLFEFRIAMKEVESFKEDGVKKSMLKHKIEVEKRWPHPIEVKTTTIDEFYYIIEDINESGGQSDK